MHRAIDRTPGKFVGGTDIEEVGGAVRIMQPLLCLRGRQRGQAKALCSSLTERSRAAASTGAEGTATVKRSLPCSSAWPARYQPCVPFSSASTGLGRPRFSSVWAPMMLRVRPAQCTTTGVFGLGSSAGSRSARSPLGQLSAPGTVILRCSSSERPSTSTKLSPAARRATRSSALRRGVCWMCSTSSPNVLEGTLTPLNKV
jgi:hypothetical protein